MVVDLSVLLEGTVLLGGTASVLLGGTASLGGSVLLTVLSGGGRFLEELRSSLPTCELG